MSEFPRLCSDAVPIIAPLWANYNLRKQGRVYYRVATDPATLAKAKALIDERNQLSFDDFSPTRSIVVTWDNVVLLRSAFNDKEVNIIVIDNYV